ncbi:MAG TPA: GAF domain-containing protein, partial [Gemmatimonadales bacterium]
MTSPLPDGTRRIVVHPPALLPSPKTSGEGGTLNGGATPRPHSDTSEARKLGTLVDVSQALAGHLSLQAGLSAVLLTLGRRCGAVRGAVALLDERSGELQIRAGIGLSFPGQSTRYRVGEGITGEVAATGEPIVVPQISQDPRFLHRAASRHERRHGEFSFICVP